MFLPSSVQSYLDGRLDQFEDRMASLLYKQSVELDMSMSILADWVHLDEEYLRRKRAESVANVKKPQRSYSSGTTGKACAGAAGQ